MSNKSGVPGAEERPSYDTGWTQTGFDRSSLLTTPASVRSSNSIQAASEYHLWSDPIIDRFDDVPILPVTNPVMGSCPSGDQTSDDACPLSDLLTDDMVAETVSFGSQAKIVTNYQSSTDNVQSLQPSSFNSSQYSNNSSFLPGSSNSFQSFSQSNFESTSVSALRAAGLSGYGSFESPRSQQLNFEPRGNQLQCTNYAVHQQNQSFDDRSSVTIHQFQAPNSYQFKTAPLPGPMPIQNRPQQHAHSSQHPPRHDYHSDFYYSQQLRQPFGYTPDHEQSYIASRQRFLSAPGGAFARMQTDQFNTSASPSFFTSSSSFNNSGDFTQMQGERSRSPFSRSSSAGGGGAHSPWCPSPLQSALQLNQGPMSGYTEPINPHHQVNTQHAEGCATSSNVSSAYFWQYNTQSKQRGHRQHTINDPYTFDEDFRDPIFASEEGEEPEIIKDAVAHGQQLRHPGKARRGDGTDTTPNPTLLFCIGKLLAQLNSEINGIHAYQQQLEQQELMLQSHVKSRNASGNSVDSGSNLPTNRREKNMLASRVCRLKRKAQHEANKIVMAGLKYESEQVLRSIAAVEEMLSERILGIQNKQEISSKSSSDSSSPGSMLSPSSSILHEFRQKIAQFSNPNYRCAGRTSEFVADVLQRVSAGDATGGLNTIVATTDGDEDSDGEQFAAILARHRSKQASGAASSPQVIESMSSKQIRKRHHSSHPRLMGHKVHVADSNNTARYHPSYPRDIL